MKITSIILALYLSQFSLAQTDSCKIMEMKRSEMNVIASNIANLNTTRTAEGGPYKRKSLVCNGQGCEIAESSEVLVKFQPDHPDANNLGYVTYPDIDLMKEITAMINANKEYEIAQKICSEM